MTRCIWSEHPIDESSQLQDAYSTCEDCLIPLPTE